MSVDLNALFADALMARPIRRMAACGGTKLWRERLHDHGRLDFDRAHPEVAQHWNRRSRELTRGLAAEDPRRAKWRAEFRSYLAMALRWYRRNTSIGARPSRKEAFASEAERLRIFGEDA